jgi:thiol-disulfide isomerase/thioredoxin
MVQTRRKLLAGLTGLAAAGLLPAGLGATQSKAGPKPGASCEQLSDAQRRLPLDFEVPLLDGEGGTFRFADHVGEPIWLNFFATWCGPCMDEVSAIDALVNRYAPQGLTMLAIDVGEDPALVRRIRDARHLRYPIALDPDKKLYSRLGLEHYPVHMFYTVQATVSCVVIGSLEESEMQNEIAVIMSALPAASPSPSASSGA